MTQANDRLSQQISSNETNNLHNIIMDAIKVMNDSDTIMKDKSMQQANVTTHELTINN